MSEHTEQPAEAEEHGVEPGLTTPGAITYLHIPADDVHQAARFYERVFGWQISNPESDRPSFETPNGQLSGAWISGDLIARAPGLLPYVYVDDVDSAVAGIIANGGEIVTNPFAEGRLTVATFRDPAGNTIGLWHDTTR